MAGTTILIPDNIPWISTNTFFKLNNSLNIKGNLFIHWSSQAYHQALQNVLV
jgi:hypothetical protein